MSTEPILGEGKNSVASSGLSVSVDAGIHHESNSAIHCGRQGVLLQLVPFFSISDEAPEEDFDLDSCTVGDWGPAPVVFPLDIGTSSQQHSQAEEVAMAAGEMECRVAFAVSPLHRLPGPAGHVGEEYLQDDVVSTETSFHDGIAASCIGS